MKTIIKSLCRISIQKQKIKCLPYTLTTTKCFSTDKISKGKAPDDFYDEQVEKEKEFFDIIDTIEKKVDLQGLTVSKVSFM